MNDEMQRVLAMENMTDGEYYAESFRQYAEAHGTEDPSRAWILTPFDVWEKNPHYRGPDVPHPEDYDYE